MNTKRWRCELCGFEYDEAVGLPNDGIAPGTAGADVSEDGCCPDCGAAKDEFQMVLVVD